MEGKIEQSIGLCCGLVVVVVEDKLDTTSAIVEASTTLLTNVGNSDDNKVEFIHTTTQCFMVSTPIFRQT